MFRSAKYIITDNPVWGERAIIFDNGFAHNEFKNLNPISAGFVDIKSNNGVVEVSCYGKSTSLRLDSRPEDDAIVLRSLQLHRQ